MLWNRDFQKKRNSIIYFKIIINHHGDRPLNQTEDFTIEMKWNEIECAKEHAIWCIKHHSNWLMQRYQINYQIRAAFVWKKLSQATVGEGFKIRQHPRRSWSFDRNIHLSYNVKICVNLLLEKLSCKCMSQETALLVSFLSACQCESNGQWCAAKFREAPKATSQISRVNHPSPPITWLCPTSHFQSLGVSWDALLVFWITNPKAECLSGYLFTSGLAFCLSMSPSLPSYHLCSTVKQAQPSFNKMQTMLCKCVCVNMKSNAWMDDKQCEIMTRFEYVWVCVSNEGNGRTRACTYICVCSKGGNISKWTQMCVCGLEHIWQLSRVCVFMSCSHCVYEQQL